MASKKRKRQSVQFELWSAGDKYDEPMYIGSYKDKGEAERFAARLAKSHDYAYRYTVKRVAGRKARRHNPLRREVVRGRRLRRRSES